MYISGIINLIGPVLKLFSFSGNRDRGVGEQALLSPAQPVYPDIDWHKHRWIAPGLDDLRGPCPGLNTFVMGGSIYTSLSNHGFLPRDGRGITIPIALNGIHSAFNIQPDEQMILAAKLGLLTTDAPDSFTLDDLKLHGTIEHDASLSRSDSALGDNVHFNETIFATLAESNPGVDYYDTNSAGIVMAKRLQEQMLVNLNITNTAKEYESRLLESSLYLATMGDPLTGVAPKKFVQVLFREERLPIEEGWKRSPIAGNATTMLGLMEKIAQSSTWTPGAGCPWVRLQPEGGVTAEFR